MRRGSRGRLTKRERIESNNRLTSFYAAAAGVEARLIPIAPKRTRRPAGHDGRRLEKHVLADCLQALRSDPRVAFVERQNSGVFREGDRYITVGTRGALDIKGMLIGGRTFEIECKRPGEQPDERQQNRIEAILRNGGIAGCAHSAEEALALLP